jgi:hypothetical protein
MVIPVYAELSTCYSVGRDCHLITHKYGCLRYDSGGTGLTSLARTAG